MAWQRQLRLAPCPAKGPRYFLACRQKNIDVEFRPSCTVLRRLEKARTIEDYYSYTTTADLGSWCHYSITSHGNERSMTILQVDCSSYFFSLASSFKASENYKPIKWCGVVQNEGDSLSQVSPNGLHLVIGGSSSSVNHEVKMSCFSKPFSK